MKDLYIRAFRAIDDKEASMKFVEGHRRVLEFVGVTEVTSSSSEWIDNPNVYVILIESGDRTKVHGGARLHIKDATTKLPLEEATVELDEKICELVEKQIINGTGEICGLWNSLEVAGYGIGSTYAIRSAICIMPMIKMKTCFALCSPYTARIASDYGFKIETSIGKNGTFYYPKIDLLATVVFLNNSYEISNGSPSELMIIDNLRKNPNSQSMEVGKKGEVLVTYELTL